MSLRPSKMSRIRLVFSKVHYDDVMTFLGEYGVVQIENLPEEVRAMLYDYKTDDYEKINSALHKLRGLKAVLTPYHNREHFTLNSKRQALAETNRISIDSAVSKIKKEQEAIRAEMKEINSDLSTLKLISGIKGDLSALNSRYVESFIIAGAEKDNFIQKASELDVEIINGSGCTLLVSQISDREKLSKIANELKVNLKKLPAFHGSVGQAKVQLTKRMKKLDSDSSALQGRLDKISKQYYEKISALAEYFEIEYQKISLVTKVMGSGHLAVLEGWAEDKSVDSLQMGVDSITKGAFILEKVKTDSIPPTKMNNPATFKLYEFFIKFYSLPKSNEIDPTIFFGIAFPIFFGLMVGDFGYGAVMLVLGLWLVHRINHPPKVSRVPKKISAFVRTIMSKRSLLMVAKVIIPGSIIAMGLGVIFNEYFGFALPYNALFNVTKNVGTLLLLSGWIGVGMVSFGFVLGAINKILVRDLKGAAGRMGWLMAAWGIVILGLDILSKENIGPSNISALVSYVLLAAGIAVILKSEGAQSLMEVPSVISHMLSYTRLMGILLASVILAQVINLIFLSSLNGSIFIIATGVFILVLGQVFNIVIALFEAGIQGARLIYVEFFSKFFTGNGTQFSPFKIKRTLTKDKYLKPSRAEKN